MGEYVGWARDLARELSAAGFTVDPDPPHTNTFQVHAPGRADAVNERLAEFMERERLAPGSPWWDAPVPGLVTTEVAVQGAALAHDPAQVARLWTEIVGLRRS